MVEGITIVSKEVMGLSSTPEWIRRTQLTGIGGTIAFCVIGIGVVSVVVASRADVIAATLPMAFSSWFAIRHFRNMTSRNHSHRFILSDKGIRVERSWKGKRRGKTDIPWKNVEQIVQDDQGLTIHCAWGIIISVPYSCWESAADAMSLIACKHRRAIKLALPTTG